MKMLAHCNTTGKKLQLENQQCKKLLENSSIIPSSSSAPHGCSSPPAHGCDSPLARGCSNPVPHQFCKTVICWENRITQRKTILFWERGGWGEGGEGEGERGRDRDTCALRLAMVYLTLPHPDNSPHSNCSRNQLQCEYYLTKMLGIRSFGDPKFICCIYTLYSQPEGAWSWSYRPLRANHHGRGNHVQVPCKSSTCT